MAMLKTLDDFHTAVYLRDHHRARLERFVARRLNRGETPREAARSATRYAILTDLLGDGADFPFTQNQENLLRSLGYTSWEQGTIYERANHG